MALLALASIYPHYYGFWTLWGYFNDDFYEQVLVSLMCSHSSNIKLQVQHQLLFSFTEAISTIMVLRLADSNLQASPQRLMVSGLSITAANLIIYSQTSVQVIVGIAGGHVLAAAWDQFVGNVMRGEGGLHQVGKGVTRTKNVP